MHQGLTYEQDGRIILLTFIDSEDETVAEWGALMRQAIDSTPPGEPFLILVDVSAPDVAFTAAARRTSQELVAAYRMRRGRMAFIFGWVVGPYIARIFFASLGRIVFELNFFNSREKGIAWLKERT